MNYSEIANIAVSIVSVGIALVALFQTKRQIALSNKQQLFDRRLSCFLEFNTIYNLYVANKLSQKSSTDFLIILASLRKCRNCLEYQAFPAFCVSEDTPHIMAYRSLIWRSKVVKP